MKYFKITIIALFASIAGLFSSCNFLDVEDYYSDTLNYDSVFHNKVNLERYMWNIANNFPNAGKIIQSPYTPGPLASDEGIVLYNLDNYQGQAFALGRVTPYDLKSFNNWNSMYKNIRRVNVLLSRMHEAIDLKPVDENYIRSYARFIRAYSYYNLFINFGPLILVGDEVLPNNEPNAFYGRYRATYDETADYICAELEEAAKYMQEEVSIPEFGRPTQGAAYALVARLRLQQASPLFNGGSAARRIYGSWTRSVDGVHYVSQVYDERKWAVAAAAAKRVIELGGGNMYQLHTVPRDVETPPLPAGVPAADFPLGAGGIDHYRSYNEIFTGEAIPQQNKELIWGQMANDEMNEMNKLSFAYTELGGYNGLSVSQKVVDAYRTADGKDKKPEDEIGFYQGGSKKFSGYTLNNDISNMYANREMRFYASIGFSQRFWTASSTTQAQWKNKTISYHIGGNASRYDAPNSNTDYPITGYVLTKFIHPEDSFKGDASIRLDKSFPTIRYAEILLAYAEALNHLTKSYDIELSNGLFDPKTYTVSRDKDEIAKHFNMIRFRAGLPGLEDADLSTVESFQKVLERELMVEFLFENRRYFDVRRWGIYEEVDAEPFTGMDINAQRDQFYKRTIINHQRTRDRVVHNKLIFLPLPNDEIRNVKGLDQNPGY